MDNRIDVEEIHIEGRHGRVLFQFLNIDLALEPEIAQRIAFALMTEADRAIKG